MVVTSEKSSWETGVLLMCMESRGNSWGWELVASFLICRPLGLLVNRWCRGLVHSYKPSVGVLQT